VRDHRRLAAIVSLDVAGYARLMGLDDSGTLASLKAHRSELIDPKIAQHGGRIVKTTGDGLLLEFPSVVDAVRCAVDVQRGMAERNRGSAPAKSLDFRIGINVGDIIIDGDDIFGDGVNVAARLQEVADPGGICISHSVHENVRNRIDSEFVGGGARHLKNIDQEVRVWCWRPGAAPVPAVPPGPVLLPLPDKPSIAVLPFANMSGDPEQEYFADGIVEDITTGLSRFSSLFVIARNSSFTYKGKAIDVKQVGRELGVRYVLEGSVRKAGDRVRITGQLIEAGTGGHVWAERYDGDLKDIFTLQEDIARRIVGTIAPEIVLAEQSRIGQIPQQAVRAYDLAMQSLSLCRRGEYTHDRSLIEKAFDLANDAHSADPASAPACYALAETLSELAERARLRGDMPALLDKAAAVAETLRDLDPTNHAGYYLIGHAAIRRRRAAEALSNLRRAHELNPNDCRTLQYLAWAEFNLGLSSEAREHAELALRLSPRDPQRYISYWVIAFAAFVAGSPQIGVDWARKAIAENSTFFHGYGILAACLAESGESEEAQTAIAYLLRHDPVYIRSRLGGDNYFGIPELSTRFTSALRKAAGPLLADTAPRE
jgi:TolB-like protein/class 3 adenylate cyclase